MSKVFVPPLRGGPSLKQMSTGYGICGAKNVYSSRVKLDNWVEDEIGTALASQPRPPVGRYMSDTADKHCNPRDMQAHPSMTTIKMMSTAELKAKNKEGTSYAQLFNHGPEMTVDERFTSAYKRLFTQSNAAALAFQEKDLEKEKSKQQTRETTRLYRLNTTSRDMNAFLTCPELDRGLAFKPRVVLGESLPIQRVGKHHILSETF